MRADSIRTIVGRLGELPYDCILFDGPWGIGKTYAIEKAFSESEKGESVCRISMFGLQNSQQIYHEVLFQSVLKNKKAGKAGGFAFDVLDGIASIWKEAEQAKTVLEKLARERELFLMVSRIFTSLHVIVIDDLERISEEVGLEEVLGIVEELKQCSYVKVILVANTGMFGEKEKQIFEKYHEKVIDRIYHVTEMPEQVDWGHMRIHAGFIREFLNMHKVKNLRTLQKAQNFYEDVRLSCTEIPNETFWEEVRLICFAIVVETTDQLYYRVPDKTEKDQMKKMFADLHNDPEHRIGEYLTGIRSSRGLTALLYRYYKNERPLTDEEMQAEYQSFLKAGEKPNYYKTDEEIRRLLPSLRDKMETDYLYQLNRAVDEYVTWSELIGEDSSSVLEEYGAKYREILRKNVRQGNMEDLNVTYDIWHLQSKTVKEALQKEREAARQEMVDSMVEFLRTTTKGKKASACARKLRDLFDSSVFRELICRRAERLLNKVSFPVEVIDAEQYDTCWNLMYILYHSNQKQLLEYWEKLKTECDHMAVYRVSKVIEELQG
ncbi:MAG: AAA family ATPase [Candidatus Limivivens sp.]|nr:AAA family ATPase [Candidatus Limivivens sp.]